MVAEAVTIEWGSLSTPLGAVAVAARDGRVCAVTFEEGRARRREHLERRFPEARHARGRDPGGAVTALGRYFDGDLSALDDLEVDVAGTPFQEAVWSALRSVEAGSTATYGELAHRVGRPRAVRAVGTATGGNPVGIVVPCHRIVPAGGGVGEYGGGSERKRWLLRHEGAR